MGIKLPNYNWFVNKQGAMYVTNIYTGSCGTNPHTGCLNSTTFNYKVYADFSDDDNGSKIVAEHWLITPWSLGAKREKYTKAEFENSADGLLAAQNWLIDESSDYCVGKF